MKTLTAFLLDHARRYPGMQVADLYKLLHQAALGCEHAAPDEQTARQRLEQELAEMGAGPVEPLCDPLPPGGALVRLHLRPFRQAGGNPQTLLRAFLRTAGEWPRSPQTLRRYGLRAVHLANQGRLPFSPSEIAAFFATMEAQGFPAVHHSPSFAARHRPAYRVVGRAWLELP